MNIRKEIIDGLTELTSIRRLLHQQPEIGFNTYQTMALVEKLMGQQAEECDGFSGVFYLKGRKEDCIAYRCELDGLPIQEKNETEYKSENQRMHACGHDAHMAMLIMTFKYLRRHEQEYSALFIFQPAEESGAGAKHMLAKGIIEKYHVKELYATHVMPSLGDVVGCRAGTLMAQSCEIRIEIQGKKAHAAHPTLGIDAIKAMQTMLMQLYETVPKIRPNLVHIGVIQGGEACNIIASKCSAQGTMRCFENEWAEWLKQEITNILARVDNEFQTDSKAFFSEGYDAVVNDRILSEKVKQIAGVDYAEIEALALSEDFSFYGKKCPCCMFLCGLSSHIDLHHDCFDLNERECLKGVEMFVSLMEAF